ncbi:uncharacterized protein SEPMUDRAFT_149562 [Sphaerulina musiva SO2202]|uniref:Uncharacterized protein n=1 Tax=Sphaerulina musiva (strain SO2202) TaxID=692275 RepID=N1QK96_SPHMS|nr:uncharacterized protein SEPMUDRAFT_149562 [Sphaerulina musiva SO2202]EMF11626.1 hypothetical protein SEPMUDRAFT_149562 [Sphaerulina musiva SO2202]
MFISSILIITTILQGQQRQGIIVHAAKITLTQEIQITTTIHVSPTTTSTWTLLLEEGSTLLPPLTALVPVSGPGTLATTTGISILGTYNDDDDDDAVSPSSHHYYHQTPTQTSTLTRDSASYQPSSFSSSSTTNTPASKVLLIGSDNGSASALPLTAGGSAQTISGTRYSLDECRLFVDTTKTAMLGYSGRECEPTTTTATATATATSVIRKIWTSTRTVPVEVTSKVIMMPAAAAAAGGGRLYAGVNSTRVGIGRNHTLATTTTSSAAAAATTATKGIVLLGAPLAGQRNSTMTRSRAPWTSTSSSSSGITASGSATATSQSGASFGCEVDRRILVWWLMMAGVLFLLVG